MPSTAANDRKRARTMSQIPLWVSASTSQIVFSADWSWLNALVEPKSRTARPMTVATAPASWRPALSISDWIAVAPSSPTRVADLADDLALRRLLAEQRAGHRDRDDQDGGEREDRVVGERGPERQAVVAVPLDRGALHQPPDRSHGPGSQQGACRQIGQTR